MQLFLKFLLIPTTLILLIATYLHPISAITQDLGRHIKTGEIITTTHSVPKTNLYSYTYPGFPFINHHWGSEVLFYLTYQATGFTGTLLLTFCASLLAFLLVYFYALKSSGSSLLALSLVSFLSLGILFERTDVRPEAFSFLFLAFFITILFKNRKTPTKWIYALIPLELLWTNTHVYFIIGIVVIGLFFIDNLWNVILNEVKNPKRSFVSLRMAKEGFQQLNSRTVQQFLPLLTVLSCSILISLLNPNGLSGLLYPFHVFQNYGYQIEENQNIFFLWNYSQKRTIAFFWVYVVLLFVTLTFRTKQTKPIDWFLFITFTCLGISAIRNMPLLIFATFIPLTYHLSALLSPVIESSAKQNEAISKQSNNRAMKQWILISCLLLLFLWQINYVFTNKPVGFSTPTGASQGVDFLQKHHIKGPIFNNFDIGSYLIFRLYPQEKVFVDGRPEAYPAEFFQNIYIPMQLDPILFEKRDEKYQFNTIFFSHTDQTPWAKQFLQKITKNKKWQIVYLDDTVIILTKNASVKPLSLHKYPIDPSLSLSSLYKLFSFFQTIEDENKQREVLQQIIEKYPTDCGALGQLLQTIPQNDPVIPIYQARYIANCQ